MVNLCSRAGAWIKQLRHLGYKTLKFPHSPNCTSSFLSCPIFSQVIVIVQLRQWSSSSNKVFIKYMALCVLNKCLRWRYTKIQLLTSDASQRRSCFRKSQPEVCRVTQTVIVRPLSNSELRVVCQHSGMNHFRCIAFSSSQVPVT